MCHIQTRPTSSLMAISTITTNSKSNPWKGKTKKDDNMIGRIRFLHVFCWLQSVAVKRSLRVNSKPRAAQTAQCLYLLHASVESGRSEKCQPNPGCLQPAVRSPLRSRRQWKPPLGICARRCHVKTRMLALPHNWRVRAPLHSLLEWFCTVVSHFDETKLHHRGFCFFTLVYVCFFMTETFGIESPPLCEVGIQLFVTAHLNNEV